MREELPLATIQAAVLEFLRDRDDAVVFGAQAVNAYVAETRMSQDVDIATTRGRKFADELRKVLNERFHIAVRVRKVREGLGYRVYQICKPSNRHLVDIRPVKLLPPSERIDGVLVVTPPELIAGKVMAWVRRRGKPKAGSDWRDLAHLLLRFPELKKEDGEVADRLTAHEASSAIVNAWKELVAQDIRAEDDEDEFDY